MHRETLNRAIFLLLFPVLAGCGGGPERVVLKGGTEHLPLLDGRTLSYRERENTEEHTYTVQMRYAGGKTTRVYPLLFKGIKMGHCVFRSDGKQVIFSTDKPLTALMSLPEYRQIWVDEAAKIGDEWNDMDTGTKTMLAGFETVTVPAGTYENCYKTVTTVLPVFLDSLQAWRERGDLSDDEYRDWQADSKDIIVRWFASGVGLVKEQINSSDHTRELVSVVKTGTGKIDIDSTQSDSE